MHLFKLAVAPTSGRDRVFRYSPARALALAVAVIGASGVLVWIGWQRESWLAWYLAGVLLLGLLVLRRLILARLRPSNWLVRMGNDGLLVQFRSYLNHRFPADDPTVVFIPYGEIRSARLVREQRDIPYTDAEAGRRRALRTTVERRWLVELELAGDYAALAQALAGEGTGPRLEAARREGHTASWYRHHPVRMASATRLQIEWGVVPGAKAFLGALPGHVLVTPDAHRSEDYTTLERLSREEQERCLRELAETGQMIAAIQMARTLYAYDLTEAKAFVEALRTRRAGRADTPPGAG